MAYYFKDPLPLVEATAAVIEVIRYAPQYTGCLGVSSGVKGAGYARDFDAESREEGEKAFLAILGSGATFAAYDMYRLGEDYYATITDAAIGFGGAAGAKPLVAKAALQWPDGDRFIVFLGFQDDEARDHFKAACDFKDLVV